MDAKLCEECRKRRERLLEQMDGESIAILTATQENIKERPYDFPLRQSSDFYYLTGLIEPNVIAVFIPHRKEGEYVLFASERKSEREMWLGEQVGQERATKEYGADESFSLTQVDSILPNLLLGKSKLYCEINESIEIDKQIFSWLETAKNKALPNMSVPEEFVKIGKITHELRLIKSPYEIELIKKAAEIALSAHRHVMCSACPGMFEYQLEAELIYKYMQSEGSQAAFKPIVASGANACTIHYAKNDAPLRDGDLVLIDAGVHYQYYASDISRTIPVGRRFNDAQRAIYEAVLDTQMKVIEKIKPGLSWGELDKTAELIMSKKLLDLGILHGDLEKIIETKEFKRFYMHRIGHWLGLDTHDAGEYAINGKWRPLESGMVLTIEPGVYIRKNSEGVHEKWWDIGIRIEDEILVTENGSEILTRALPKTIEAIEAMKN